MDEYGSYIDQWQPDNETAVRYCVVRITPGINDASDPTLITNPGLYVHHNSAHIAVGPTRLGIQPSSGRIHIETDGPVFGHKNGVVLVTGDEAAATRGLLFGGSGGADHLDIQCYKIGTGPLDLAEQADYDEAADNLLNLWIAWLSPLTRGTGQPSKADQALTAIADLQARVSALESA